ncbi:cyclophilin-like fold protein [Desulfovirgula thermocuniculi]|uniref:cyclophilin-like fold protein n=1 Tax=Desulfovirgula thermocuniculi TaxID=348842 RepID=UPI00041422BF|nr:cyclophilin-like fold protein [Desulfovirgula thermocuniculi]
MRAVIRVGGLSWPAVIYDTPTGRAVWSSLPLKGYARRWGEEIYFAVPVEVDLEPGASEVVSRGDLGYWPPGKALCIFFGPTPLSRGEEIRAASAVNIFGRVEGDLSGLREVKEGAEVLVEAQD